jgi:hypothetical protein
MKRPVDRLLQIAQLVLAAMFVVLAIGASSRCSVRSEFARRSSLLLLSLSSDERVCRDDETGCQRVLVVDCDAVSSYDQQCAVSES